MRRFARAARGTTLAPAAASIAAAAPLAATPAGEPAAPLAATPAGEPAAMLAATLAGEPAAPVTGPDQGAMRTG